MTPVLMALITIIFLLTSAVLVLGHCLDALRVVIAGLVRIEDEIVGVIDEQEFEDAPDMIEMLGNAYAPRDLHVLGEAAVDGALASRQMTSHELADALLGEKLPEPVPGDVLEI